MKCVRCLPVFSRLCRYRHRVPHEDYLPIVALVLTLSLVSAATAAQVIPLGDLRVSEDASSPASSSPSDFVAFGPKTLFSAFDPRHGTELWITDGTPAGTELLRDIYPGTESSDPHSFEIAGGLAYFLAESPDTAEELWVTDGTPGGTHVVMDELGPGVSETAGSKAAVGNDLFFRRTTEASGAELWQVAPGGVPALVVDLVPGPDSSSPSWLQAVGPRVAYRASTVLGRELAISSGVGGQTSFIDLNPGSASSDPTVLGSVLGGSRIFVAAEGDAAGRELWRVDLGGSGTWYATRITDLSPGAGDSNPREPALLDGELYFVADTPRGREFYKTSGGSPTFLAAVGLFVSPTTLDDVVVFRKDSELWVAGDTAATTVNITPAGVTVLGSPVEKDGWAYFRAGGTGANQIWGTNGTLAGTQLTASCPLGCGTRLARGGDALYSPVSGSGVGREPFRLGTSFELLRDIAIETGSHPQDFVVAGSDLFFHADVEGVGRELFRWSGAGAPLLFEDLRAGPDDSRPADPLIAGGDLYYTALGVTARELRRIPVGQSASQSVTAAPSWATLPEPRGALGNRPLFEVEDGAGDRRLWTVVAGGAVEIAAGELAHRAEMAVLDGGAFFFAMDGALGTELWSTDGTFANVAADLAPGSSSCCGPRIVAGEDVLFLESDDPPYGEGILRSNGTPAGTWLVHSGEALLEGWLPLNDGLLFYGYDEATGYEPWFADAYGGGSAPLADIEPGDGSSVPDSALDDGTSVTNGTRAFFRAWNSLVGMELWVTEGTPSSTRLIRDLAPGLAGSHPDQLVALPNGQVMFAAFTPSTGRELWISDGTEAGTVLAADLVPGPGSSSPVGLRLYGDLVVFSADTDAGGREAFAYDWTIGPVVFTDGFESGDLARWN